MRKVGLFEAKQKCRAGGRASRGERSDHQEGKFAAEIVPAREEWMQKKSSRDGANSQTREALAGCEIKDFD